MEMNPHALNLIPSIVQSVAAVLPAHYARSSAPRILSAESAAGRRSLVTPVDMVLDLDGQAMPISSTTIDLDVAANWDSASQSYAAAANRAGKDVYLYATADKLILSANATVPASYTAGSSRKIGGFHCLCLSVGTISGHTLTGFLTGDILPSSIWDLRHRPTCGPEGMVYSDQADIWADIYLQSGTAATTASANGATITDTRVWMDHVDDLASVGKRLLWDAEFQVISEGANQKTNIAGSSDPVTTGGHVDTAGRRMISNIGCEDCCGAMNQWLLDQSYRNDDASYLGTWSWYTLPGNKGSFYRQGGAGDVKLVAGGAWDNGTYCGSRFRNAYSSRWTAVTTFGARGCARSHAGVA